MTPSPRPAPARGLFEGALGHLHGTREFTRFSAAADERRPVARRGNEDVQETMFRAQTAGWIAALRRVPNPAVALFEPDGVEFAAAMVGAWYAGKTVYLPGDTCPATCRALRALDVAFVGTFADDCHPMARPNVGETTEAFAPLDADAVHVVIYTSGSSGAPQANKKRLGQLLAEIETLEGLFGAQLGECDVLASVSHQHIYGLLFKILWPLIAQRPFHAESVFYPEGIVAHLAERRTAVVSGPAHLKRLPMSLDWASARAGACVVFSSGGPLPLAAVRSVEATFAIAPIEIYGSSETGGIAWRQRSGAREQPWTTMPGVAVREHEGSLAVRSRHLPDDYWHVVADQVAFDGNARFTLIGRADRIAKIEGNRVSLSGIEDALTRPGLAAEAHVVLLVSERDELGAVVVPSDEGWATIRQHGARELRRQLEASVAEAVGPIGRPRRWRWVDALPVNAVGKTTEEAIRHLFVPSALTRPAVHALERTRDHAHFELYVSPRLECFDGHFPGIPVLPGVAQLDWAVAIGRESFPIIGAFERMEAVKFHRLYRPGPLLSLDLQWKDERSMLLFRFTSSEIPRSSGRIFFTR